MYSYIGTNFPNMGSDFDLKVCKILHFLDTVIRFHCMN